ncbi:MAG TPA: hypothetical protein VKT77_15645 [Chthonomonadaceae bacterium]|nr:hypothetical protein [Chthonomonadaceae bacterium]
MKTIIGAIVILAGVIMISWDLSCFYHNMPVSLAMLAGGLVCALIGASWIQGERPRPI